MKLLITGSSSGIGRHIAEVFLNQSNTVIGLARDHTKFQSGNPNYVCYEVDFANFDNWVEFKNIAKSHQDIDTIIINAGYGEFKELEQFSDNEIMNMFNVNVISQMMLVKSLLPGLKKRANEQIHNKIDQISQSPIVKIIFIGSEASISGSKKGSIYCATKFAMRGFAQSLRAECAASNISVTTINPGMVKTDFYKNHNFSHGDAPGNYITKSDISSIVELVLNSGCNVSFDEVNMSPMKKVIKFDKV